MTRFQIAPACFEANTLRASHLSMRTGQRWNAHHLILRCEAKPSPEGCSSPKPTQRAGSA